MKHGIYKTVVIDPPWDQGGGLPYSSMSLEDIAAMDLSRWAAEESHCYLWITQRYLEHGAALLRGWGFDSKPTTLVWAKPSSSYGGGAFACSTEFCIFAWKGERQNTKGKKVMRTWWDWKRPRKQEILDGGGDGKVHSAKPQELYDLAERVSHGPYVEVFARYRRPGWDGWGWEYPGPPAGAVPYDIPEELEAEVAWDGRLVPGRTPEDDRLLAAQRPWDGTPEDVELHREQEGRRRRTLEAGPAFGAPRYAPQWRGSYHHTNQLGG